tara:strand:+ start:404 stop:670 length:267 start_codon:yes stop_codon:yes gene_type:complete
MSVEQGLSSRCDDIKRELPVPINIPTSGDDCSKKLNQKLSKNEYSFEFNPIDPNNNSPPNYFNQRLLNRLRGSQNNLAVEENFNNIEF